MLVERIVMLDVAVIIVSWNVRDYLVQCLRSVFADLQRSTLRGEVWVVDNASTDGTADLVQSLFPNVRLIVNQDNPGFGAANNQGMAAAKKLAPRYYFLLNPDTKVQPGAIAALVETLEGWRVPAWFMATAVFNTAPSTFRGCASWRLISSPCPLAFTRAAGTAVIPRVNWPKAANPFPSIIHWELP